MAGHGPGRERQSLIYRDGAMGRRPKVPTDFASLEAAARKASSPRAWAYVSGGAGEGRTLVANREAFERHRIAPRVAHGTDRRVLATSVLGTPMAAPLMLAPVGAASLMGKDSDVTIARAAAATGTPYVFSNQGCNPMEETTAAMRGTPHWMQLYWSTSDAVVDSLIARAEDTGATALVVTLDTTSLGWRPQDLNIGSLPFSRGEGIAQYTSDPSFASLSADPVTAAPRATRPGVTLSVIRTLIAISRNHPGGLLSNLRSSVPRRSVETFLSTYSNPGLSWEHLATLRSRTRLPNLVKGVLRPDDAVRALDIGMNGLVVSNHGGRQVDNSIASLDALVDVREAVGPEPTVLFDSGTRTGADVFVAVALGPTRCCWVGPTCTDSRSPASRASKT